MTPIETQMLAALRVIARTPGVRAHLKAEDPMALRQVEAAIAAAEETEEALAEHMDRLFDEDLDRLDHEMGGAREWDDPVLGGAR